MWGQAEMEQYTTSLEGIIPTRVGTRHTITEKLISRKDHPHACGDKTHLTASKGTRPGSSPRVWGQGCVDSDCRNSDRIIPTRVGTSQRGA